MRKTKLTNTETREAMAFLDAQLKKIEGSSNSGQFNICKDHFDSTFKELMSEDSYNYAIAGINSVISRKNLKSSISYGEIRKILLSEIDFLEKITSMPSVPLLALREIQKYLVLGFKGKSKSHDFWRPSGSQEEALLRERLIKRAGIAIRNDRCTRAAVGELPQGFTSHLQASPFYTEKFKTWLMGEKSVAKNVEKHSPETKALVIEIYLILAKHFEITNDSKEDLQGLKKIKDKSERLKAVREIMDKGLPRKYAPIAKIIEVRTNLKPGQIYGIIKASLQKKK